MTSELFICPSSQGERAQGETREEVAKKLSNPLHLTYVYCGKGRTDKAPADAILAYEIPNNHNKQGMNFLCADGHVEFHNKAGAHFIAEIEAGHNPPRAQLKR